MPPSTDKTTTVPTGIRQSAQEPQPARVPAQRQAPKAPQATTMAYGPLNVPLPWHGTEIATMEFQQISLPSHASTGWHYHHGPLLVTVHQGTLRRPLADGTVTAHPAGTSFVEPPGPSNIHTGHNPDSTTVILWCLFLLPPGSPLSVPVQEPGTARPAAPPT
ncbi:hypothetical protein AB5J49_03350 [Streptomyces sp. R28]|uniref:Cupin domain-containing protein n=1 Tax=Streptomyces sp. R28 TaxID=3238628 RepID=A0AB39PRQ1_9ACTN